MASIADVVLFCGYEVVFVLGPGWLIYRTLSARQHGALRELSIGWALGHVTEILAFGLTAALHLRGWFVAYPVLVAAATVPGMRRLIGKKARAERLLGATPNLSARWAWAIAGVIAVSLLYATAILFVQTPLPGPRTFTGWYPDLVFHLNLSAEALHHWPLTDPSVSGARLPYQNFVYMRLASIAQVTGIRLPVLLLRLYLVPLLVVFVLTLSWAGRALTGQTWSGPVAAGLLLLVGEVNPTSSHLLVLEAHFLMAILLGLSSSCPRLCSWLSAYMQSRRRLVSADHGLC